MKYAILVCDGAADWPLPELGNKTIFEAANTPYLNFIASKGKMGLLKTIPDSMHPGSETANMAIMGYRPETDLTGRGALEALSAKVELGIDDIAFRCNLITIEDGLIKDYSSGHITTEESLPLIEMIQKNLKQPGVDFFPGIQYRHILRIDGKKFSEKIDCTPPHDQLEKPYKNFLIKATNNNDLEAQKTALFLNSLIEKSNSLLIQDPINLKRAKQGKRMATHIWFWSGGKKPAIESFEEKYGLKGSVISAVDLIFGIGIAAGLQPLYVEGATGLPDTNYEGKIQTAIEALKERDFVYLHVEAADEMGHAGDISRKVQALEDFDQKIIKPLLEAEKDFNDEITIAVLPDHPTPIKIRTHSREPVPFAIYSPKMVNTDEKEKIVREFSEKTAKEGEYGLIENGEAFMKLFLSN